MKKINLSIVKSYYQLINSGEFKEQAFPDLFTEDVITFYPKFGMAVGVQGIRDFSKQVRNLFQRLRFELDQFTYIVHDNHVIVEGKESGISQSGVEFPDEIHSHGKFCTVFELENSRIKRMYCYIDPDLAAEDTVRLRQLTKTTVRAAKQTTEEQTKAVVNAFYAILSGKSDGDIVELFADEVDWDLPGNTERFEWLGKRKTKADISAFFKELYRNIKPETFEIEFILVKGEDAVSVGQLSSTIIQYKQVFDSPFVVIFKVRQGKIIKYHFMEDSYKLNEVK